MAPLRVLISLVLFLDARRLFVRAHLFSWLVDWQTICEPDFIQCPNGGLTFRDRNHECEFTPCELIPNPPLPAPPDPKTLSVTKWFGRYEFVVPTFNAAALQRGKILEREWSQAIVTKSEHAMRANFSAMIDLYVVAQPPVNASVASMYATRGQDLHVDALIASQAELFVEEDGDASSSSSSRSGSHAPGYSSTARELAVSMPPWTRWEFFGQVGASRTPPKAMTIQIALRLLENATDLAQGPAASEAKSSIGCSTLVVEAATDIDIMTDLLAQCDIVNPSTPGESTPSAVSVLVFPTDFRGAVDAKLSVANVEMLRPWNVTRIQCDQSMISKADAQLANASANVSSDRTASPKTKLLWRPRNTSHSSDAGYKDALHDQGNRTRCSCWMRSLAGSIDRITKWMLCQ